mmetsp:Transcript_42551/g.47370  ORF Transcript_42551/g.47370 Transcript_42551/m.47370 type:complete len:155 (+) Transcript_42551:125-589(+)
MEVELQVEKEIQTQEVVDKDTVVVCSSANNDGDHVNEEKQRQDIERENDNNNDNKNRIRMESRTHRIILVTTKKDGRELWKPNKARNDHKDKVLKKELRFLHAEEDEQFVKGWFCFQFIEPTKSNPMATASEITEIQTVQRNYTKNYRKSSKKK